MDAFRAEGIRLKLKHMFRAGGYFSICELETLLRVAEIEVPREQMDELRPLHCISWSEMTPQMREEVFRRTVALFSIPEMKFEELSVPLIGGSDQKQVRGLFRRLLGKGAADA